MPSILVLEQDPRSLERIHQTLGALGWRVRVAGEAAQVFQAATAERPDLVIVGAAANGAASVAGSFSRRIGGPGVLGLLPPGASAAGFASLAADVFLAVPFSDQELVAAVQRAGTAPKAPTAALQRPRPESKLTSLDIFGDVLAEVALAGEEPDAPAPAAPPPAAAPAAYRPPRPAMDDDLNRKLEQTLSGVLGADTGRPRPPAPAPIPPRPVQPLAAAPPAPAALPVRPPAPRKPEAADDDIDAILSRTLGTLEIGSRPRPAAPRPPAPPPVAAPPPVSPLEGTAIRKAPRSTDGGLTQLEELTRTFRAPAAPVPAPQPPRAAAPEPPAPAVPAVPPSPAPPPAQAAAPPPQPVLPQPAPPPLVVPPPAGIRTPEPLPAFGLAAPLLPEPPAVPDPAALGAPADGLFGMDPFDLTALELPPPAEPIEPAAPEPAFDRDAPFELPDLEMEPDAEIEEIEIEAEPESPRSLAAEEDLPPTLAGAAIPGGRFDAATTQRIPVLLDDSTLNIPGAERFGQYTLLEKIAAGGMAEVWKARMRGVEGFQKTVAIKKILPHMTDNSEFIGMFIDEAKLAAQLSHPNIVHIYDLGKIGRDYYIAMEYVEGKDLRSLLNASRRKGTPLSLGLALLIAARVASALDYAHRKRDFEGKELSLVHRDVSPQNVLLTHEGDVKLCDFGIAKAVSKAGQTQVGSLKGKLQYMSPEQAKGSPVDSRSDIFSLGAVLFEMLTGERLFSGDSEMSILEAVRQGQIRSPRSVDPTIPAEVNEIVARALAYDVRNRFQSAGEMMQRIETVLHTLVPSPGPGELAAFLSRVLAAEPSSDVMFLPPPAARVPAPAPLPPPAPAAAAPVRWPEPEVPASLFSPEPSPAEASAVAAVAPLGEVHVEEMGGGRKSRLFLYIAILVLLAAAIAVFFYVRGRGGAVPPSTGPAAQPASATPPPATTGQVAPAAEPIDVDAIVKEEMEKKNEELRRKYEARTKELERELAKAQAQQGKAPAAEGQPPP